MKQILAAVAAIVIMLAPASAQAPTKGTILPNIPSGEELRQRLKEGVLVIFTPAGLHILSEKGHILISWEEIAAYFRAVKEAQSKI